MSIKTKMDLSEYRKYFEITIYNRQRVIAYKGVPLWRCGSDSLDVLEFVVLGGDFDDNVQEPYILSVRDECGDFYSYGCWRTLDDVRGWLEHPFDLHGD